MIVAVINMILSISNLSKLYGDTPILKNITFKIEEREKIAIIGVNGAGKTTLFKILSGQTEPTSGTLNFAKNVTVGYLAQTTDLDLELTAKENLLLVFNDLFALENEIHHLEKQMAHLQGQDLEIIMKRYDTLSHRYQELEGYSIKSKVRGVLSGLGFSDEQNEMPVKNLSGGQKTRLSLAKLLLKEPDLLLLDEPTNHLDINAISWLEGYLKNYKKAVLIISHDRYFLDEVVSSIIEIEHGKSTLYKGNYHAYASTKKINRDLELKHYLDQQKIIKKQEESIALLKSFNREKQIKRAESKEKQLAKMEKLDRPEALPQEISLNFRPRKDSGFEVLRVRDLKKSFDRLLFENLNFDVKKNDRIAIIGPNGVGKTTFFKILLNQLKADSGKITLGSRVEMAYYDQEHASLNPNLTVFDDVHDAYPLMTNQQIRQSLAAFQFKGEDVFKEINVLSGGEKGRVVLCKLLLKQANFLILDEPTNHLDIQSKEVLEDALNSFEGTILFISHDRYFINKIANKVLDFRSDGCQMIDGNYDEYLRFIKPVDDIKPVQTVTLTRQQMIEKRQIENSLKKVERQITDFEQQIESINQTLQSEEVQNDYKKYNELIENRDQFEANLMELMEEWESLQAKL